MNDRQMLELAAKAAGLTIHKRLQRERDESGNGDAGLWVMQDGELLHSCWNPLKDDGNALRLAVKLQLSVYSGTYKVACEFIPQEEDGQILCVHDQYGDDPYAATRRAIVRAAAQIGASMP